MITGRQPVAKGIPFEVNDSEYADDKAMLFDSRQSAVKYCSLLVSHYKQYGIAIHTGNERDPKKKSKIEVLFFQLLPCLTKILAHMTMQISMSYR